MDGCVGPAVDGSQLPGLTWLKPHSSLLLHSLEALDQTMSRPGGQLLRRPSRPPESPAVYGLIDGAAARHAALISPLSDETEQEVFLFPHESAAVH